MANDLWRTSPIVFEYFNKRCKFTLDVAADDENHLLPAYITKEGDALTQSWAGERCFCCPFGQVSA
jgi:hypothetical protein